MGGTGWNLDWINLSSIDINFWQHLELNPGLLSEKRKSFLCVTQTPRISKLYLRPLVHFCSGLNKRTYFRKPTRTTCTASWCHPAGCARANTRRPRSRGRRLRVEFFRWPTCRTGCPMASIDTSLSLDSRYFLSDGKTFSKPKEF